MFCQFCSLLIDIETLLLVVRLSMDEIHQFLKERGIEEKTLAEMDRDKVSNIVIIFPMLMSL